MSNLDAQTGLLSIDVPHEMMDHIKAYPLPDQVPDADMNQDELAAAFNVSANSINKWIKAGMPVAEQGGNGKSYVLRLSHCYAWKKAREADEAAQRSRNQRSIELMQAQFLGLEVDDPKAQLTPKQRREIAEAELSYQKARLGRRQLVELAEVVDLLTSLLATVRDGLSSMPDVLERTLNLETHQVETVVQVVDDTLTALERQIDDAELVERDLEDIEPSQTLLV